MKAAVFLFLIFSGASSFANGCPNFAGRYRALAGDIYRIYQNDCLSIRVLYQENIMGPSVELNFLMDGGRHEIGGIFWSAFWDGQQFAREPWSAIQGGELLGDREVWALVNESGNPTIRQQFVHPEDGLLVSEKKLRKVGEN